MNPDASNHRQGSLLNFVAVLFIIIIGLGCALVYAYRKHPPTQYVCDELRAACSDIENATEHLGDAFDETLVLMRIRDRRPLYNSEGLRHIPEIWERAWALEEPGLATPYRTHGGTL